MCSDRPYRFSTFLALLLWLVSGAVQASGDDQPAYVLGSGDKLRVTIFNEDDLSGEYQVNDQGAVSLPLVGQVQATGKTVLQFEKFITDKFADTYLVNPRVSVEVLNYRPFFILGEVKNPSSYPCSGGLTVLNAVALAGGFTPRAAKSSIKLRRAGLEKEVGDDTLLQPGDVITVPERFF